MRTVSLCVVLVAALTVFGACDRKPVPKTSTVAKEGSPKKPVGSGRIDIPATVRQNLGITFAKAETRRVTGTLRGMPFT